MAAATVRQDGDTLAFGGVLERAAVASLWSQLRAAKASAASVSYTHLTLPTTERV